MKLFRKMKHNFEIEFQRKWNLNSKTYMEKKANVDICQCKNKIFVFYFVCQNRANEFWTNLVCGCWGLKCYLIFQVQNRIEGEIKISKFLLFFAMPCSAQSRSMFISRLLVLILLILGCTFIDKFFLKCLHACSMFWISPSPFASLPVLIVCACVPAMLPYWYFDGQKKL